MKTEKLIAALRRLADPFGCIGKCSDCAYCAADVPFGYDFEVCDRVRLHTDAADKIEELTDRCARYAGKAEVDKHGGAAAGVWRVGAGSGQRQGGKHHPARHRDVRHILGRLGAGRLPAGGGCSREVVASHGGEPGKRGW